LLLSLQREVKMEPGILGDHSDYSHCLSLRGTEDGPPCPRLEVGSQSCPLNNTPLRVGGPGPGHLMSLGENVAVPHPSGLLPLSSPPGG